MANVRRKSANFIPGSSQKDIYNPFPDLPQRSFHETKKSPKNSNAAGKCLQLMLICQKLLKPFNSTSKATHKDVSKKISIIKGKSKSSQEINQSDRSKCHCTAFKSGKTDEPRDLAKEVNLDIWPNNVVSKFIEDFDNNHGSEDFPYDIEDSVKDGFWDLDIDSAIVGDFNSMSNLSLNDEVDPHYATINLATDGNEHTVSRQVFITSIHPEDRLSSRYSNTSSPQSGVYSKIIKPTENKYFYPIPVELGPHNGSRLNFERIMAVRSQLGLCQDVGVHVAPYEVHRVSATPDLPLRTYGSSVVNYINELRLNGASPNSGESRYPSFKNMGVATTTYASIWSQQPDYSAEDRDTILPEVLTVHRPVNKVLHQLNPLYCDDSSESASNISVNSPSRMIWFSCIDKRDNFPDHHRVPEGLRRYETLYAVDDRRGS